MEEISDLEYDVSASSRMIVQRMFIHTADNNYITARWLFLNQMQSDFFWLAAHAIEKYLKAILLLNGKSSHSYGHNIVKLYESTLEVGDFIFPDHFVRPEKLHHIFWRERTIEQYIQHIAEKGNFNNRYMLYGYSFSHCDLFKLDQLVWAIRRCCRAHKQILNPFDEEVNQQDWMHILKNYPNEWRLHNFSPIEKLLYENDRTLLKEIFLKLNYPFAPEQTESPNQGCFGSANSPLDEWFMYMENPSASAETHEVARRVLEWVKNNIQLNKTDKDYIDKLISTHKS